MDGITLIAALRADADRHEARARAIGDLIPPGRWDAAVSLHAIAARFRARADLLDAVCIERVGLEN
jgi:hypothetical protein